VSRKRKKQKASSRKKRSTKGKVPSNRFTIDIDSERHKAIQYYESGQLQRAEKTCKEILRMNPNHPDSLYLLGIITHQIGKADVATNLINKAILSDPENPFYYCSLGNVFHNQGKLDEAISCYQKTVQFDPSFIEAYHNIGVVLQHQGKLDEAISYYQKTVELKPDYAEAYNNMGNVFHNQGKLDEAISCYEKALDVRPGYAGVCYNIGNVFHNQGKLDEAISYYQKAVQLKPDYAEAYNNMGNVFYDQGKLDEAISCYEEVVQLKPDYAEAYNNMGNVFHNQGKSDEAISYYQEAVRLKPDYAEAYNNMGSGFKGKGELDEAISCYQKAVQLKPDYAEAYSELVHALRQTCTWQELERVTAKLDNFTTKALDNGTRTAEMPIINLTIHDDPSRNFAVAKSWSSDIARTMSNSRMHFSFDDKQWCKTRIVVGYLSDDFHDHPVAHLMLSLFGLHNRDEFEVFCYSYGPDDGSYYSKRIQQDSDRFVDVRNLGHVDAAKCIYNDQVDILVDLKGYETGSRLAICALRPAPIQVSYLGFLGTTGADFLDYIITDRIVTPEDHACYYSENFVYLPHCYQVNDHTQTVSNKDCTNADFGLSEDSFVFCSFNSPYKIERVMFDIWMKILRQIPEGVLWLLGGNEAAERNLRREAWDSGVAPERLFFSKRLPLDEHLARLKLADLALDTRVYNGGATTSNALWAGVPVITLQGSHFLSRMSASSLSAIGLSELITHSLEEYEALAVRLACNPDELQAIRERLAKNRLTKPLFDTPRFARNLEKAYKEMWEIFLGGEKPRQIEVMEN
jgi:protein O-GlcNAc transferase